MSGLIITLASFALISLVAMSSALVLTSCRLNLGLLPERFDTCPDPVRETALSAAEMVARENRAIETQILQLERRLAAKTCVARDVDPILPEPEIDTRAWNSRDIGALAGCWDLESVFTTVDQATGQELPFDTWNICFDSAGNGRETMRAPNGTVCSGSITGAFSDAGELNLNQPGNLQCSDGTFIFRLASACVLQEDNRVQCRVHQPETQRSTTIDFRRAERRD